MTDQYTAVLDRFEGEQAVLLLEDGGETVGDVVVGRDTLPADGAHQDAMFTVTVTDDGDLETIEYQPERTEQRHEHAQSRFDRLSKRPPSFSDGADTETEHNTNPDPETDIDKNRPSTDDDWD